MADHEARVRELERAADHFRRRRTDASGMLDRSDVVTELERMAAGLDPNTRDPALAGGTADPEAREGADRGRWVLPGGSTGDLSLFSAKLAWARPDWPENPNIPRFCRDCGGVLMIENLFVCDGCPCNSPKGVNFKPQPCLICRTDDCTRPGHRLAELFGGPRLAVPAPGTPAPPPPEALARRFHETYERLAPSFGYETRKDSAVPWEQVPERNRKLMIAVCAELAEGIPPPPEADRLRSAWERGRNAAVEHLRWIADHETSAFVADVLRKNAKHVAALAPPTTREDGHNAD